MNIDQRIEEIYLKLRQAWLSAYHESVSGGDGSAEEWKKTKEKESLNEFKHLFQELGEHVIGEEILITDELIKEMFNQLELKGGDYFRFVMNTVKEGQRQRLKEALK